jgi:hypothetical protein
MAKHLAAILAPAAALFASCVLDLSDLTGGAPAGGAGGATHASSSRSSTTTGGTGGASSSSGGAGGQAPGVLDCAPCPGGGCDATALASGADADGPDGIALDTDALYWVNRGSGAVMRLPASGGAPSVLASANQPTALAVMGGYVVWAAADGVYGCPASGCAAATVKIAGALTNGSIQGVAYDGQYVYYTDDGGAGGGPNNGEAVRCPPNAGCHGGVVLGPGLNLPGGISLYGDEVFWTETADGNQNGNIDFSPKGGDLSQLASELDLPTTVVADDTYAYWPLHEATGGKIQRCAWGAAPCATPDDLATGLSAPLDVGLANGRIYWSDTGDGEVLSCPTSGCAGAPPEVHASGRQDLRHIALGTSCVFFTDDTNGGSVSKAPLGD